MGYLVPKVGDRIGKLEVLSYTPKEVKESDPVYKSLTRRVTYLFFQFKCGCGNVFERSEEELPDKLDNWPRDCGCGAAGVAVSEKSVRTGQVGRPKLPVSQRRLQNSVYLLVETWGVLETYAGTQGISVSAAIEKLVKIGLEVEKLS